MTGLVQSQVSQNFSLGQNIVSEKRKLAHHIAVEKSQREAISEQESDHAENKKRQDSKPTHNSAVDTPKLAFEDAKEGTDSFNSINVMRQ